MWPIKELSNTDLLENIGAVYKVGEDEKIYAIKSPVGLLDVLEAVESGTDWDAYTVNLDENKWNGIYYVCTVKQAKFCCEINYQIKFGGIPLTQIRSGETPLPSALQFNCDSDNRISNLRFIFASSSSFDERYDDINFDGMVDVKIINQHGLIVKSILIKDRWVTVKEWGNAAKTEAITEMNESEYHFDKERGQWLPIKK